ncbi:MAG TPA: hypothetical protein VJR47_08680 [Stellaceae bacterium]|nr:hypothetical protein [Stellaceae bacterium]
MSVLLGRVTAPLALIVTTMLLGACAGPAVAPSAPTTQAAPLAATPASVVATRRLPNLQQLKGLKPSEILAMLGQPELRRDESPGELWQYRASDCVLNLFFYREAGGYRLLSAETWTSATAASATPTRCSDAQAPLQTNRGSTQSAL